MSPTIRIGLLLALPVLGCLASKPTLYYFDPSAPCRTVLMTLKVLGVDVDLKEVSIMQGAQLEPDFIKINPRHTIPTLDDNGFILSESRAIQAYLANTNPNGEKLYPKDPQKRARVDEMLYFDIGRLYQDFLDLYAPMLWFGQPYNQDKAKRLEEAFKYLDLYLGKSEWAAGSEMSLADISLVATVSTAEACDYDISKHPNVAKWYAKCKSSIPDYEQANKVGADMFHQFFTAATST